MFSVVIATPDVVGERMAGPGIRAWHLAEELKKHFPTQLMAHGSWSRDAMRSASVLIGQPARGFHRMKKGQRIIYDLFDPVLLELREMYGRHPSLRQRLHFFAEQIRLRRALSEGDLFIIATPHQRELYPNRPMIEVPFGTDAAEWSAADLGDDRENLIIWGGGTWEWLDPRTAVDAVVRVNREGIDCRMLFLGRSRPNPALADRRRDSRFDALVAAGRPYVTANPEWVPYRERFSWLRRSKIAMMLHRSTAEARYAIRTRLFDAIGAATPVIASQEGFAAELVAGEGLGIVVPPGDVAAVAAAIKKLLTDDAFHSTCVSNLERIRPRFAWPVVVRPLVEALNRWQS
ncbi:MAG TPA: glycosyltransferase [Thermoanaerobaculia bacterium]|nr:glycosyltransferase [Thermoanaerobaculia bacterium]